MGTGVASTGRARHHCRLIKLRQLDNSLCCRISLGQFGPFATPPGNGRYLRSPDGWSRRILFSNVSRVGAFLGISTLRGACVLCMLQQRASFFIVLLVVLTGLGIYGSNHERLVLDIVSSARRSEIRDAFRVRERNRKLQSERLRVAWATGSDCTDEISQAAHLTILVTDPHFIRTRSEV